MTPSCTTSESSLSLQRGQKAEASKLSLWGSWNRRLSLSAQDLGGWGLLGLQLSESHGLSARPVPRGLAAGHGAPVRGAAAAPAGTPFPGQPVGIPGVCTLCVVEVGEGRQFCFLWGS